MKTTSDGTTEAEAAGPAGFQEAAAASGVPVPGVRRTVDGAVLARSADLAVRVLQWVDLEPADAGRDPSLVDDLVGRLHQVPDGPWAAGMPSTVAPWFATPVGAQAWDDVVGAVSARKAPFGAALEAQRDELVAFDFDNSGPADPTQELAVVLVEYATGGPEKAGAAQPARARSLVEAYKDVGGPGRLDGPSSFSKVIAVLGHPAEHAARFWLAATDDVTRDAMTAWVAELVDQPFTRRVMTDLLEACR